MNSLSIIVPTYNSAASVERCLRSIKTLALKHELNAEIVVVDANSEDETVEIARRYASHIIMTTKTTIGKDRNLGAEIAKHETLAFIDSDCEVSESWMDVVAKLEDLGFEMLTGPVLLARSKTSLGESARDLLSASILTLNSYTFSGPRTKRSIVREAPSANILISKEVFKRVGGFPELSFNEDTLFSKRFRACGGKIVNDPRLLCFHHKHFDSLGYFAKYFFHYGLNYGRTFREFHLIRRYALVSFAVPLAAVILVMTIFLRLIDPFVLLVLFVVLFFILLMHSVVRNRKLNSILIPFLLIVLATSYIGGFYFGFFRTKK